MTAAPYRGPDITTRPAQPWSVVAAGGLAVLLGLLLMVFAARNVVMALQLTEAAFAAQLREREPGLADAEVEVMMLVGKAMAFGVASAIGLTGLVVGVLGVALLRGSRRVRTPMWILTGLAGLFGLCIGTGEPPEQAKQLGPFLSTGLPLLIFGCGAAAAVLMALRRSREYFLTAAADAPDRRNAHH